MKRPEQTRIPGAATTASRGRWRSLGLPACAATPKESTSLQAQVDAGELPPINERLPENPLVITPDRPAGPAGRRLEPRAGRRRLAVDGGALPGLRAAGPLHARLVGHRAERRRESYEVNEDGTVYTFKLRKGMKWSDGEPFTTEDIRFWYEDIFLDPDVSQPTGQTYWTIRRREGQARGHRRADLQASSSPRRTASSCRASPGRNQDQTVRAPAHYLKQFHNKYNPDADALAKERGFEILDRAVPARERRRRGQRLLPELRSARRSTPGSSRSRPARTPSGRSRCATPTTSRSTPRGRSSPTSTASPTRWSPIRRSCC